MQHRLFILKTHRIYDGGMSNRTLPKVGRCWLLHLGCQALKEKLAWTQDTIKLFGKTHLIPRLNAWYGDSGTDFSYSGIP